MYILGKGYGYQQDSFGNILVRREEDSAEVYLQGDDANLLRAELNALDAIEYPCGPFQNYEEHLDVILGQYDTVMQ